MSTILVAAILVGAVVAICLLLISISNKQKFRKMNTLLNHFSQLGTLYGLSFSSQEVLNNNIIGLDGINRKLLFVTQKDDASFDDYVVSLSEVKNCTVKKHYGNIAPGELKNKKLGTFLERVTLHVELQNGKDPVEISFYNHIDNNIYQLADIEKKAERWMQIIQQMLKSSLKKIA
jgi:hypothetical protein